METILREAILSMVQSAARIRLPDPTGERLPDDHPGPPRRGPLNWTNWVPGLVSVYATLFGVGRLVFGDLPQAGNLLGNAAVSFAWIARNLQREGPQRVPDRAGP